MTQWLQVAISQVENNADSTRTHHLKLDQTVLRMDIDEINLYLYYALGRRVMKILDSTGLNQRFRYIYGGHSNWQVLEEQVVIPPAPPSTTLTVVPVTTFVYRRNIDEVISMRRETSGADYWYHCDDLHSVTALTNLNGAPVEHYEYGAYGVPVVINASGNQLPRGSAFGNPYMFTGRRYDLESRFYYYRTRYYEPTIGRFTTRDTIGIWGDAYNLGNASNYVASNPWTYVDPWGLFRTKKSAPPQFIITPAKTNGHVRVIQHNYTYNDGLLYFGPPTGLTHSGTTDHGEFDLRDPDEALRLEKTINDATAFKQLLNEALDATDGLGYTVGGAITACLTGGLKRGGTNALLKDLHRNGFRYNGPTRKGGGRKYINPQTGEEVRVMPPPRRRHRTDPSGKHEGDEGYYRYRPGPGYDEGGPVPIHSNPNRKR